MRPCSVSVRSDKLRFSMHRRMIESMRREKKYIKKINNSRGGGLARLAALFGRRIPDVHRKRLATRVLALYLREQQNTIEPKASNDIAQFIIKKLRRRLVLETNDKIRCELLKTVIESRWYQQKDDLDKMEVILELLCQSHLLLHPALHELHEIMCGWSEHDYYPGLCAEIIRTCLIFLDLHTTVKPLPDRTLLLLLKTIEIICDVEFIPSCVVDIAIASECWLRYLFDFICEGRKGEIHDCCAMTLAGILSGSEHQRARLCILYFSRMQKAFARMDFEALIWICSHRQYASIIAWDDELLRIVAEGLKKSWETTPETGINDSPFPTMVVDLLNYGVEYDILRGKMLDYEFLKVSTHFCTSHFLADGYIGSTFRRVLAKEPRWRQTFKKWTANGAIDSETSRIGMEIPDRVAKPGQWYVWEEEDYS